MKRFNLIALFFAFLVAFTPDQALESPSGIKLMVDEKVEYNGGDIDGRIVFCIGEGCREERQ